MAIAVSICAATELITQAREVAASSEMDSMGPGLRIVPAGVTASDLAQMNFGQQFLDAQLAEQIIDDVSPWIRAVEARLMLVEEVRGQRAIVVGLEPRSAVGYAELLGNLQENEVAVGTQMAEKLGLREGQSLPLMRTNLKVAAILPSSATTDDLALFVPLKVVQSLAGVGEVVSELRLYPLPGNSLEKASAYLRSHYSHVKVIVPDRDSEARQGIEQSLQHYRWVLYLGMACVAAISILIWAHFNASDRRVEMATMVAVGGSCSTVFGVLALRAAIVGLIGAVLGYALAAIIALSKDYHSALPVVFTWTFLGSLITGTVIISILGAMPAALTSALRQHVTVLQE
jgi:ABC-type lipoprotein release transport system permease subunit